jgi:hypothetical protein
VDDSLNESLPEIKQDPNTKSDPNAGDFEGKWGGLRPGIGRPKGSTNIHSKESVKKLQELGVDPIEKLVEIYLGIQDRLDELQSKSRPSGIMISQLINTQTSIMTTLAKYGYRTVPEKTEQVIEEKKPLKIVLTSE